VKNLQTQPLVDISEVDCEISETQLWVTNEPAYYSPFETPPVESWRYEYVKRGIDILCAATMLLFFAIPGLLIAAAILLSSKGGVFYREERIGRFGRPFRILKFRSMYPPCTWADHIANSNAKDHAGHYWRMRKHLIDPRITVMGGFLRRWSLDELPQLLNVLSGEMSLIGPRPIVLAETAMYGELLTTYQDARPGLSGLWQVSGRSDVGYEGRSKLDAEYVRSWSLQLDFVILLKTIPAVLRRVGAR
jgi:lipopolysaccharide/colanic/teichoic acid biosynthesis glycosyltransferase